MYYLDWYDVEELLLLLAFLSPYLFVIFGAIVIWIYEDWPRVWKALFSVFCVVLCVASVFSINLLRNFGEMAAKPVIYLYPEEEMNIDVTLSKPENITCDYPEYNDGWNVIAKPTGDIHDLDSSKDLYCLYYESEFGGAEIENDGFVVESKDTADFLDEKLEILGLSDKERNEFIIYWLPRLEVNKYNYIRFLTEDEINNCQELDISPKPDSVIRVMMSYKGLDRPINVREQKLKAAERAGFTVVEWGGTEIR